MATCKKRILLVDDNAAIHEDFKQILCSETFLKDVEQAALESELFDDGSGGPSAISGIQYDIDDAYQGEEAIEKVDAAAAAGEPYALIFMDVRMPPGIDGIQTIQNIWKKHPDIEMVVCTAYSDYSWEEILNMLGTTHHLLFVQKPFNSVTIKQIALTMTKKWELDRQNKAHIVNLESRIAERTKDLQELVIEKEMFIDKINEDLTLAEIVQHQLLPRALPELKTMEIAASYIPATGVGGDLYDVIKLDEVNYAILIFDVSGHGVAAALITAIGKFSFKQHLQETMDPKEVLTLVNKDICISTPPHMYITAFLIIYNTETREVRFSSAGHTPQLHYRKAYNDIQELRIRCLFLGVDTGTKFKTESLVLENGDKLILFTDGLTETCRENDTLFGRQRLKDVILEKPNLSSTEMKDFILKKNEEFREGFNRLDDLCLLVIDIKN